MPPPVPSSIPSLHAFDPQSTSWKSYRDRIQFYFEANRIVEVKEKKALFLWSIGNATYQLLENLISPRSFMSFVIDDFETFPIHVVTGLFLVFSNGAL